jgi:hypothetical protein
MMQNTFEDAKTMPRCVPDMVSSGCRTHRLKPQVLVGLAYLAAAALGLALALRTFPIDFLWPMAPPDGPLMEGDLAQHVIGQRYFIADAWRWQLLMVPGLGQPDGTNIGLTDSIPLLALALKAFASWLPREFHGLGFWYGISWTLQPVAALWCIRAAGETRWLPAFCMVLVSVSMPVWWSRFGHAALTGQFLLLMALGCYFILVRRGSVGRWLGATVLLCGTLLVHPYLFLMNSAILAAAPTTLLFRRDRGLGLAVVGISLSLAIALFGAWWLGYLGTQGEGGFGRFAMNLLSPVWPADSWILNVNLGRIHAEDVSGWEGYNYLGAGLLAGLAVVAALVPGVAWTGLRSHGGLVLALLTLTVLALSNRIGIGYSRVIELYQAPSWLETFRSSGRLFWPVAYALALGVVLGSSQIQRKYWRACVLLIVAALQFADAAKMRDNVRQQAHAPARAWMVDAAALRTIFASHRSAVLLPQWGCVGPGDDRGSQSSILLELLTLASETTIPLNTMQEARWHRTVDCNAGDLVRTRPGPGEVRILLPNVAKALLPLIPDSHRLCRPVGILMVCSNNE